MGAQVVVLPEYFCIMGQKDTDKVAVAEDYRADLPDDSTPIQLAMQMLAKQHQVYVIAGTIPLKCPDADKVYNTTLVYAPDGAVVARYDKIHLFGFNNGMESYDEARTIYAGDTAQAPVVWDSPWGKIGLSICYDVRFPALYRALALAGAEVIVTPAAFTRPTGEAHWETLLRARAIETGSFVLAPAQGGFHEDGRGTWGRTLAIGPWGEVLGKLDHDEPGVLLVDLDLAQSAKARAAIPNLKNARAFTGPL